MQDTTSGTILVNQRDTLQSNSGTFTIPTTLGHEIYVRLSLLAETGLAATPAYDEKSATLTYDMSVVPEPISSILFMTGGALLAGRCYLKRKKK